jgi:hypothetical protein
MRKIMFAASIVAVIAAALTTEAAHRSRRQAQAPEAPQPPQPRPPLFTKDTPAAARLRAMQDPVVRQAAEPYRGLSVEPDPEATGDTLALQERIAALLARMDYVPAHRVDHFRWITEEMRLKIVGWHGRILETKPTRDGIRVLMKVWPVAGIGTSDHTLESYLYADGRLVHLNSEGAPTRGLVFF